MDRLTETQRSLLRAVVDRIVPADAESGATGFGADRYILGQLEGQLAAEAPSIAAGLDALGDFVALSDDQQDAALGAREKQPWFRRLIALTQEGAFIDIQRGH